MRQNDISGKTFGLLTAISIAKPAPKRTWLCKCSCGNEKIVQQSKLCHKTTPVRSCGCLRAKFIDLSGKRFSKLVAIDYTFQNRWNKKSAFWRCKCDCGNEVEILASNLTMGNTRSCGCIRTLPDSLGAKRDIYRQYKGHAHSNNRVFDVSEEQVFELIIQNCHYCGNGPSNNIGSFFYNGLDRIDNMDGYRIGNIVTCCKKCNFAKSSLSYPEFTEWLDKIAQFRKAEPLIRRK